MRRQKRMRTKTKKGMFIKIEIRENTLKPRFEAVSQNSMYVNN